MRPMTSSLWCGWRDSNPHQPVSETGASAGLRHIRPIQGIACDADFNSAAAWPARRGRVVHRPLHLTAGELRDQLRRRGVETDDVEHARILGIGDREA